MTPAAIFASAAVRMAAAGGGGVTKDVLTVVLGLVGAVAVAWVTGKFTARSSVRVAQINAEVQAEEIEAQNTQAQMDGLRTDLDRLRTELADVKAEAAQLRTDARERDRRDEADRTQRMVHSAWDWNTYHAATKAGATVTEPPALYAPPNS